MQKNILLLTGWGATCKVWQPLTEGLASKYELLCPNPSWVDDCENKSGEKDFDAYVESVSQKLTQDTNIIAWSYGGLIAIRLATYFPQLVKQIIFIASTPKFIGDKNFMGIDQEWYNKFKDNFGQQPQATFNRFIALQASGDEKGKLLLKQLKQYCDYTNYDLSCCSKALRYLGELDLFEELLVLKCKTSFIHGEHDAVLNIEASRDVAKQLDVNFFVINAAGHVPHVSHPEKVLSVLNLLLD